MTRDQYADEHSAYENETMCEICRDMCHDWHRCPICSRLVCRDCWSDGTCCYCDELGHQEETP